jgi:Xaa-Pro aminopeptidase
MSASIYQKRVARLQKELAQFDVSALISHLPQNVYYLSGFQSSYCILVFTEKDAHLITDGRYIESARAIEGYTIHLLAQGEKGGVGKVLKKLGIKQAAFESGVSYAFMDSLQEHTPGLELFTDEGMIAKLRRKKAADEVKTIEKSQRLNEKIFNAAVDYLRQGGPGCCTEKEFAGLLEVIMIKEGVKPSFEPIVAHGPNASLPHYHPGDVTIGKGMTLIDMGVVLDGYCSDMTRMIYLGKPGTKFERIHEAVRSAKNAAIKMIKPGADAKKVNAKATKVLEKEKLHKRFTHGLGHGVGLNIHEAPRLSGNSSDTLQQGDVVTVEPGVYWPGWGGIRIEDMVVVTKTGHKNLTKQSDQVIVIE